VRDVRARSAHELEQLARNRLLTLRAHGSTTIEVKSGYGLDLETELKQLRIVQRLARTERLSLVPTFLGAHEVPPEFRPRREAYVRLVIEEMLPAVAREGLAKACDVFCEPGVFSVP
jgi:imidazolonepropionase